VHVILSQALIKKRYDAVHLKKTFLIKKPFKLLLLLLLIFYSIQTKRQILNGK
jgi:hypothetical protein